MEQGFNSDLVFLGKDGSSGLLIRSATITFSNVPAGGATPAKFGGFDASNVLVTRTPAQVLSDIGGQAVLNGLGFVKASGTSITYDPTDYLPLTGGELLGGLIGTISSWSGRMNVRAGFSFQGVNPGGIGANAGFLDFASNQARLFSYGGDASTNGLITLLSLRSDGSNQLTIFQSGAGGSVSFPAGWSGSGNRIIVTDSNGLSAPVVIGSGLSLSAGTLTATGGSAGTVTGSGTSGIVALWNSASDIGDSIISQAGSIITVTGIVIVTGNHTVNGQSFAPFYNMTSGKGWQWGADGSGMYLYNATDARFDFRIGNTGNISTPGSFSAANFSGTSSGTNTGDQTNITGNAGTATTLQTARNIQGISFNGSANIDIINGTGFVKATGTALSYDNTAYAPLASPALTGVPTSTTPSPGDNSTKIATTAYVDAANALKAPLASPALTGTPTAPTPAAADNSTKIATTAFVRDAASLLFPYGTYTPTITNGTNVASSLARKAQYSVVGNIVTVSGALSVDPVAGGGTLTLIDVSLPIASVFTSTDEANGQGTALASLMSSIRIRSDVSGKVQFEIVADSAVNADIFYTYQYEILS